MQPSGGDLRAGMAGEAVAKLHQQLIQLGFTIPAYEVDNKVFGVGTARAVAEFQKAHSLWDTAVVDRNTVATLGRALREASAETMIIRRTPDGPGAPPPPEPVRAPEPRSPVEPPPVVGPPVVGPPVVGPPVVAPPVVWPPGPVGDPPPVRPPFEPSGPPPGRPETRRVEGRIYLDSGPPAAGVEVRLYGVGFGGAVTRLGEASTDSEGRYAVDYRTASVTATVEVRAVTTDGAEVSLSTPVRRPADTEVLNLVAPATLVTPAASEHQRLLADVVPHLDGATLAAAREDDEGSDLTVLRDVTGWDARLIALAANAEDLQERTGLRSAALYAMLRVGLPAKPDELSSVDPAVVSAALTKATQAGIVSLTPQQVKASTAAFREFATATRLAGVAPGTLSSTGAMLSTAGLSVSQQRTFDEIYAANASDTGRLWQEVARAGLPAETLALTGKLGYLTLNNATLVTKLRERVATAGGLAEVMVGDGLYQAGAWQDRLRAEARGDEAALAALIPPAYQGDTTADRLDLYAEDLARKVRLAYPTEVVTHMIGTDELRLGADHDALKEPVGTVLTRASTLGFRLGTTPVGAFVRNNSDELFAGMDRAAAGAATESMKTVARLYQITPGNEQLKVLLLEGFTSAHDVTAMSSRKFTERYGHKVGGADIADLIHRKAQQVTTVTYTFFGAAQQLDSSPTVFATAPPANILAEAKSNLVKQFPTMEQLFGSLDYCECDHCRSVLSPAAYLVDLLRFLDPPALEWQGDLAYWAAHHANAPYPFPDQAAWQKYQADWATEHPGELAPDTKIAPYEVLRQRRPDLPELPLTCENTHTVLPYIDVVNEILEYHIAHNGLDAGAVHDTGDAQSADLLAEPQHILPDVYQTTLRDARYPIGLPFNLWLETVRRFLAHFDAPLWRVLDAFRTTEALYPDVTDPAPYGYAAVFAERLGLSTDEVALLTDPAPLGNWHTLYGYDSAATATAALASAKTLSRALRISYRELVELVRTGFVNPALPTLAALRKLGIDVEDVLRYKQQPGYPPFSPAEQAKFAQDLTDLGGLAWLDAAWAAGEFASMLVLADPNAGCGFEETTLRYADGTPADAVAFLTVNYFVRLWRRLGWTIAETDRALTAFLPTDPDPRTGTTIGPAMASALLGLSHLDSLTETLGLGRKRRSALLACWSDLDDRRYAELFLTPGVLADDPVFDQPVGQYLRYLDAGVWKPYAWDPAQPENSATGNVPLATHLSAVLAAVKLTADDVREILTDAGTSVAAAPLNIATLSVLHRHALLAKALRLPVADLIVLKQLSDLDPFTPVGEQPVTDLAADHPYRQTIRFVELAAAVKASGLSVSDLDFLLRHRFDPVGSYRTAAATPLTFLRTIAGQAARIRAEHAVPDDALSLTDAVLREKLALIRPPDVVEAFLGMWTGTLTYTAVQGGVAPGAALDPDDFATETGVTVAYDEVTQQQRLTYRGVLLDPVKTQLSTDHPQPLVATLLDAVQQQAKDFFARHLQVTVVGSEPVGFLQPADFDTLFAPLPTETEEAVQAADRTRRATLAAAFLPYLQDQLIRRMVTEAVAAALSGDPATVATLLSGADLLADRAHPGEPLIAAFTGADERGGSVSTDTDSLTVSGYLEVATAGAYRFFVTCEQMGTQVELRLDHLADPLVRGTAPADGAELSAFTTLRAGVPYAFRLDASALGGGTATLLIQGETLPKGPVPLAPATAAPQEPLSVYPADRAERIRRAYLLLAKTLRVTAALELGEPEVRHLLSHRADFGGLDLGWLPTGSADDDLTQAPTLFGQLRRVMDYVALRTDLGGEPEDLLDLVVHARRRYPSDADPATARAELLTDLCDRLARFTRRRAEVVEQAATSLGIAASSTLDGDALAVTVPAFVDERGLRRLWTALALVDRLGVAPGAVAGWATPDPTFEVARSVRDTVKARYELESWRRVVQPISDALRQRKRDALVAYLLHTLDLDRLEQLFEYLLIDPGMEPVVQTSRLRLAISSVQTFIQRCLLNLEPGVHPTAIKSAHWQWMKRYRVWEANRKIFLWPENWLEPEFRDDKTHLFRRLEDVLLQGDINDDLAEDALLGYLRGLDELARLDIRTICLEERQNAASHRLHVIGRTYTAPHKYFYRWYDNQSWTPWIPVTTEIDGDHMAAIVWRDRLHVFWVTFVEKANTEDENSGSTQWQIAEKTVAALVRPKKIDIQLNWTEYFRGEWTQRSTGALGSTYTATVSASYDPKAEFIDASTGSDGAVRVNLRGEVQKAFRVVGRNGVPQPVTVQDLVPVPYSGLGFGGRFVWGKALSVNFAKEIVTKSGTTTTDWAGEPILAKTDDLYWLTANTQPSTRYSTEIGSLVSPFFFADDAHTFYVEPTLTEKTIVEWDDWVVTATPGYKLAFDLSKVDIAAQVPQMRDPMPPDPIGPVSRYTIKSDQDWLTNPLTVVAFGASPIGEAGRITSDVIMRTG